MTNDNIEALDSINQEEDTIENEEETIDEANEVEEVEESDNDEKLTALEKKVKELEAQKKHWQKKANTPKVESKTDDGLSQKDLYALMANKVHEDDIDEVVAYAKLKNIEIKEALQSSVVKSILKDSEEVRKTAEVTNTKTSRKAPQERTAEQILQKVQRGEFPDNPEDMVKAFDKITGISK
jgi:hypothetical protein